MNSLHYPAASRFAADNSIKRPPEDDGEPFELNRASHKRQAVENPAFDRPPSSSRASSDVTVQALRDKAPGELVSIILQMQSSYEQQVADLQSQYAIVSRQLAQLTDILNTHFTSQMTAIQSVQHDYFDTPSHATFSPSQTPAATSPGDPYDNVEIKITPSSDPNKPPIVVPSSLDSVADVWEEYRYGRNGNPSLESVEVRWGPRWRRDYKVQRWFNKRKIIVSKIKQYIADGVDEKAAVHELQMMRRNRTLNWLSRELESHRKETKKQWKAAREAAIANKQAMLGSGTMPANLT